MAASDEYKETFLTVARCPVVRAVYSGEQTACAAIVRTQIDGGAKEYAQFQVPEPWVGRIDLAPILFVSSNPSIGKDDHARGGAADQVIWDSHHYAFGDESHTPYIQDGIYTVDSSGQRIKPVRYWSWARARARELLPDAVPGRDYAFTEVVHCKSEREIGVAQAAPACIALHFDRVLAAAAASIVIAVGAFAQRLIFGPAVPEEPVTLTLGGRDRAVVALAHPNAFGGGKTLGGRYSADALVQMKERARMARVM